MEFTSRLENIVLLDKFILELKKKHDIGEKQYSSILASVNESVTNAITHGNRNDPSKKVLVQFKKSPSGEFIFIVSDEGVGFNWHELPDPLEAGMLNKTGGRGLFIMKNLAQRLLFNEQGNKVELHFNK